MRDWATQLGWAIDPGGPDEICLRHCREAARPGHPVVYASTHPGDQGLIALSAHATLADALTIANADRRAGVLIAPLWVCDGTTLYRPTD